jgi:hypothetical protein
VVCDHLPHEHFGAQWAGCQHHTTVIYESGRIALIQRVTVDTHLALSHKNVEEQGIRQERRGTRLKPGGVQPGILLGDPNRSRRPVLS